MNLENIKIGDKVFVTQRTGRTLETVKRLTNTQVITIKGSDPDCEYKYKRSNGNQIGSDVWYPVSIEKVATDEDIVQFNAKLEHNKHIRYLQKFDYKKLPPEVTKQIFDIVSVSISQKG